MNPFAFRILFMVYVCVSDGLSLCVSMCSVHIYRSCVCVSVCVPAPKARAARARRAPLALRSPCFLRSQRGQSCAACPLPGVRAYELHDARELSTFVSQMHPFSRAYIYGFSLPYGFTREISLTDTVSHAHIETSSVTLTDSTHTFCGTARDFSKRSTRCRRSLSGSSRRGSRRRRRRRPTGSSSQRRAPTEATWEEEMAAAARAAA